MAIFAPIPNDVKCGDQMRADWASNVVQNLRQIRGIPSGGGFQSSGGIAQLTRRNDGIISSSQPESLFAHAVGGSVKVEAGHILMGQHIVDVAEQTIDSPENDETIYIQYDGSNAWSIGHSADWPTTQYYIPLVASVTVDDSGKVSIAEENYCWLGGDIDLPLVLPVSCSGSDGDTPVYTATTLGDSGITILTDATPDNPRDPDLTYEAGTIGVAYWKADGSFGLFIFDENVKLIAKNIVTNITWDGTNLNQFKYSTKVPVLGVDDVETVIDTPAPTQITEC